jgi:hypothetical protein
MTDRDDIRERFIAAIAEKIPADSIIEAHLFQPLKQGGTESGVAVVAVAEVSPAAQRAADENVPDAPTAPAEKDVTDRLAVYTARYRLTQKGPDRGKWEFVLHVEADAPLVTVDKVVQGVQRRSGDSEDPQRLTGEEFRAALPANPSTSGAPSSFPLPPSSL